jgi:hypothetical protein
MAHHLVQWRALLNRIMNHGEISWQAEWLSAPQRLWSMELLECEFPLQKILYFVRGTELLAERSRWGRTVVAVQESRCVPTPLILLELHSFIHHHHHHHQWFYSPCKKFGHLTPKVQNLIKTLVMTPLDEWAALLKNLYLHRIRQHRNPRTSTHFSSGIRTYNPSNQAAKTCSLDRAATGIS